MTSISLPDSITRFDYTDGMFYGCKNLKSVKFPSKIPTIPDRMFYGCEKLETITIPSSVKSIGESAFADCKSLKNITIPSSVTKISEYNTFKNCTSLKSITIPDSVTEIGPYMFSGCSSLTSVKLPAYIKTLPSSIFENCKALKTINLPDYLTKIGGDAFYQCTALTSINIPNNVKDIGGSAFYGCKNLTLVKLPNNMTSLESCLFQNCTSLKQLYVPKKITQKWYYVFEGCNVKNITIYGYAGTWAKNFATENGTKFVSLTPTTSIQLSKTSLTVEKGKTAQLTATIAPSNSNYKTVAWESSNEEVAMVSGKGVIRALKEGTTEITATTADGKTVKCKVTVGDTLQFKDVPKDSWYYEAVKNTSEKGIIAGYNSTTFAPFDKVSRGQLVTMLWRIENKPDTSKLKNNFTDVPEGQYYTEAIKWANSKGIVQGYGGTTKFGPGDPIIRQDLAIVLNKYAKYKGKNATGTASLTRFKDYKMVSDYAENAVKWTVANGIISGNSLPDGSKTIAPHDNATRAEIAVMLTKYMNKFN